MMIGNKQKRLLVFHSGKITNKSFCVIANTQLRKFGLKEGLKLVQYQSHKLVSFIYSKLCETSLWPITLTAFSNMLKYQFEY